MLQDENNEQYNRAVGPDLIEVMLNGHLNSLEREIGKHRRYKLVSLASHTTAAGLFGAQAL